MLEAIPDPPKDLREHWVKVQQIVGPGNIAEKMMYREMHQLDRLQRVVELARECAPNRTCLELGCCEGRMTRMLAQNHEVVIGVDFVEELLAAAPRLPNVHYQLHDIEHWVPQQHYDVIVMSEVLEHVLDPRSLVAKMAKRCYNIVASCPINEHPNEHTFDAELLQAFQEGKLLEVGDAAGHVWAMDPEGFRSLFDGLKVNHFEVQGSSAHIIAQGEYP